MSEPQTSENPECLNLDVWAEPRISASVLNGPKEGQGLFTTYDFMLSVVLVRVLCMGNVFR